MNGRNIGICTLCFVVGCAAGRLFFREGAVPENAASDGTPSERRITRAGREAGAEFSRRRWATPDSRLDAGSAKGNEGGEVMIAVPRSLLSSLSRSKAGRSLDQAILDDRDPVEAALNLKPAEKTRIQAEWQRTREELRQLEATSLEAEDLDDGSVRLVVPDLSDDRRKLAASFHASLTGILGNDRGEVFHAIKQVDDILGSASAERSIIVKTESVGEGRWGYRMTLNDSTGRRVWVGANIPEEIRHLTDSAGIFPTITEAVRATSGE